MSCGLMGLGNEPGPVVCAGFGDLFVEAAVCTLDFLAFAAKVLAEVRFGEVAPGAGEGVVV